MSSGQRGTGEEGKGLRSASSGLEIGTPVVVTMDNGFLWRTRTRTRPWAMGDGTWVVGLEGKWLDYDGTGGYLLDRVRPATHTPVVGEGEQANDHSQDSGGKPPSSGIEPGLERAWHDECERQVERAVAAEVRAEALATRLSAVEKFAEEQLPPQYRSMLLALLDPGGVGGQEKLEDQEPSALVKNRDDNATRSGGDGS